MSSPFRPTGARGARQTRPYHVMAKPHGPVCNLDCTYCFYLRKEALFKQSAPLRMTDSVLERFIQQYIEGQAAPVITFAWQGGEPTLMGLEFFEKVIRLQAAHARSGVAIENTFQTNGVLLNDEWCRFFKEHRFLIGLSMDGPAQLHDANRLDKGGHPTFPRVHRAMKLLQAHGVDYNILCVVNRTNGDHGREVYRFLRDEGAEFIQLIAAVEANAEGGVTEWTVTPEQWGRFNIEVFDEWVLRDVGRVFVQSFDAALAAWLGMESPLCVHARTCGRGLAIEHNGDVFSCDHYVNPSHLLGNVRKRKLIELVDSREQRAFGQAKQSTLPPYCRECPVLFACNGGCPKDRFARTPQGDAGLHYLCEGYRAFFQHIDRPMRQMAALLSAGREAREIVNTGY